MGSDSCSEAGIAGNLSDVIATAKLRCGSGNKHRENINPKNRAIGLIGLRA